MKLSDLKPEEYKVEEAAPAAPTSLSALNATQQPLKLSDLGANDYTIEEPAKVEPKTSMPSAIAGGIAQGGTFGFADELYGGLKAGAQKLGIGKDQSSIMDEDQSFMGKLKSNYQADRNQYRDYQKQLSSEHPVAYKTAEIGTAVGTGLLTGGGAVGTLAKLGTAGAEGAAYGLGASEADLTEGEFKDALKDTGIGAGIGIATAGTMMGAGKLVKGGYNKIYGRGGKDLATDAAGDVLELTPTQRADAAKDVVKMGPGKTSTVAEELPNYLREKGGVVQSAKKLKQQAQKSLDDAGTEIEKVLNEYDNTLNEMVESAPDVRNVKGVDTVSTGADTFGYKLNLNELAKNKSGKEIYNKLQQSHAADQFSDKLGFKFENLAKTLEDDIAPLRNQPGFKPQLAKVDKYINELRNFKSSAGDNVIESIKELHGVRKNTDKLIKSFQGPKANQTDALLQDALIKSRREMSNHLQDNMLGEVKNFAQEQLNMGLITPEKFQELSGLQDRIYKANRDYKLANFVDTQIDQAIGRKDARKVMGLTDWIIGAQMLHSPQAGLVLGAKKVAEVARPRAQLYSRELGAGVSALSNASRAPMTQQMSGAAVNNKQPINISPDDQRSFKHDYEQMTAGTKYAPLFEGMSDQQKAVKNMLLQQSDPEYRKLQNKEEE